MLPVSVALIVLSSLQALPGAQLSRQARDLAVLVAQRTSLAESSPAQPAPRLDDGDPLAAGLVALAGQAMQLSLQMETAGGPEDLRCIYRGMAEDALSQRQALDTAELRADRLQIYAEIDYLLSHAAEIAPLADAAEIAPFTGVDPGCPRGPLP